MDFLLTIVFLQWQMDLIASYFYFYKIWETQKYFSLIVIIIFFNSFNLQTFLSSYALFFLSPGTEQRKYINHCALCTSILPSYTFIANYQMLSFFSTNSDHRPQMGSFFKKEKNIFKNLSKHYISQFSWSLISFQFQLTTEENVERGLKAF